MFLIHFCTGHRKLLHTFGTDGNYEMAEYMLQMPGIQDPAVDDGTTAFSMVLARRDLKLIGLFLASEIPCDINQKVLTEEALKEIGRHSAKCMTELKDELTKGLMENYGLQWRDDNSSKDVPKICQE